MSDIPKSKRAYSNLEAHHKALEIRRKIAVELLASFAYSEKKLEEDFACWFIKRHRDRVDDLCCRSSSRPSSRTSLVSLTRRSRR